MEYGYSTWKMRISTRLLDRHSFSNIRCCLHNSHAFPQSHLAPVRTWPFNDQRRVFSNHLFMRFENGNASLSPSQIDSSQPKAIQSQIPEIHPLAEPLSEEEHIKGIEKVLGYSFKAHKDLLDCFPFHQPSERNETNQSDFLVALGMSVVRLVGLELKKKCKKCT